MADKVLGSNNVDFAYSLSKMLLPASLFVDASGQQVLANAKGDNSVTELAKLLTIDDLYRLIPDAEFIAWKFNDKSTLLDDTISYIPSEFYKTAKWYQKAQVKAVRFIITPIINARDVLNSNEGALVATGGGLALILLSGAIPTPYSLVSLAVGLASAAIGGYKVLTSEETLTLIKGVL